VTLDGVPSAPESLSVAEIANGHSIPLTWGEPSSTGGQPITDYRIEYRQTGQPSWATFSDGVATSLSTTVTSLSNNQSYDFRVSAINNIGTSLPSNIVTAAPGEPAQVLIGSITDTTVPDIAASVTITNEGTDPYEYNYAFCVTDSSVNQCGPADGADIFSGSASKLITNGIDYTTTLTATDIPLGTYFFHLQVTFGSQTSSAHRQFTAVTAPTAPSAPTITNIVPADSTITIAFTPPENNGGADITTYTAYAYDGTSTTTAQHSTSPVTISGLTNGATYTVSLSATNSVGESPRTPTATATPEAPVVPDTTPPTITNLSPRTTLAANTTLTTLSLSTNETAQCYYATTNESDTSAMTLFTNSSDTTHSTVVYDLQNGTSYTYYVHCIDLADNQTTIATALTFSVATPTTSGGGGGGGGGRISAEEELEREYAGVPELPVSLPPAPTQSVQQDVTPQDILRLLLSLGIISEDKRAVAERMLGIYSTAIPTTRTLFTKTLSLGMTHPEVRTVQQFLNTNGCTVGHAGAGSVGNETSYFGIRTYNAVICFQERYAAEILYPLNLTQGTGYWGEKSIEKANGVGEGVL